MSNARNLADVISGNYDVPAGSLDNVDLTSRVAKTGDTMTGDLIVDTKVGVGTSSPGARLTTRATANSYTAGALQIESLSGTYKSYITNVGGLLLFSNSSTVDQLILDSAGRVTMPYQPAFHASRNSNVSWGNYDITFATQTLNRGNNFNGTIFTAPVAGVYFFTTTLSLAGGTTGQDDTMNWGFLKNGANYQILTDNWSYLMGTGGNGVDMTVSQSALISLSANDTVKVNVSGISHTGGLIQAGSSFSGYLIG